MSSSDQDTSTLKQDAGLDEPLRRVAYEAGMLLGLEATREEQGYHRRRLTRAQYWLHGAGTVAGLLVRVTPVPPAAGAPTGTAARVRVLVGAGIGIDGLGRELLVHETHCLDLADWLGAQDQGQLRDGFDDVSDVLTLRVSARYQDCAVAAQPVLARKINLGTDAVQPSRIADNVLLELAVEPPGTAARWRPWPLHPALDGALTSREQAARDALDPADPALAWAPDLLNLRLRLLHLFDDDWHPPELLPELVERARLPLARLRIATADPAAIADSLTAAMVSVDNLSRPFLPTAAQLAYLASV